MILEDDYNPIPPIWKPPKRHPVVAAARYPFRIPRRFALWLWAASAGRLTSKYVPTYVWWRKHYRWGHRLKLIDAAKYAALKKPTSQIVMAGSERPIGSPQFIAYQPDIDHSQRALIQPEVLVTEYASAEAIAGTDFVVKDGFCIYPNLYVPSRDMSHAERVGTIRTMPETGEMISSFDPAAHIDAAISLLGQTAGNYAHFLTEILPKLIIIDQLPEYAGMPLLVDIWIDRNLLSTIKAYNVTKRKIWLVHLGEPVKCDRLVTISPTAYAPPEYRAFVKEGKMPKIPPEAYQFNVQALSALRERANEIAAEDANWIGKRLYVRRKISHYGNGRSIINIENVEDFMGRSGFDFVEPSSLTPREQIAAFKNAEIVVAPVGASLANLIYAKPGCRIISLSAYFKGCDYDYFSTMMQALGHDMVHVVGPQRPVYGGHPLHHPYRIPMNDLAAAVKRAFA